jgi:ribosomal protein S12 methylthiotransferase accessory factor
MLKNPRLRYCYHAYFLDKDNVLLMSEKDKTLLTGKLFNLVLYKIQQMGAPVEELVTRLEGQASKLEIYYALEVLEKKGYITEAAPQLPQEECAYWNSQGIEVNSLINVLQEKKVSIKTISPLTRDVFLQAFSAVGIRTGKTGALNVIITDDYEREELRQINREAVKTKQPWMPVKPVGVELWLGPIFLPGKTGCWECLKQRLIINRPVNTVYRTQKKTEDNPQIPAAAVSSSLQMAAGLTALEIVKWLYFRKNDRLEGKIVTFDTHSLSGKSHVLMKRPQCKICGEPGYKIPAPKPVVLRKKSSYNAFSSGGYRDIPPEDTVEKYRHHVSPITGLVKKLTPYHSIKGTPVYNYSSGENMAFMSRSLFWLNNHIRAGNGGKGSTWCQAKAGALCEGIERYCLIYHGDEPYITASLKELGSDGIHPNVCMNFSEKQYQNREEFNKTCSKFYLMTPVPFDDSPTMHWSPVYSLTEKKFKYLPKRFCYAQYPEEDDKDAFAYSDSNGCAAGNSLEEAILQGFLELVERDSVALWWYNMLRKPAVDLPSFKDPYFNQVIEYYKSLNRGLYVLDLTTDLRIPTFAAVSHRLKGKPDIIFGFGAHVDARIGVERALTELNQILPIANVSGADRAQGKYRTSDREFLHWLNTATIENHPYLVPLEKIPTKKASDYPWLCEPNIYDSLIFCLNTTIKQGMETLVLDMTRPDVDLPVVRVMVPGLRHFWPRLAPGRLYDVPVKMGLLDVPLKEEELNPIGLFI